MSTRARGLAGAVARRVVLFVALACVVLSFGMVAGNSRAADRPQSFSESALAAARQESRALSDAAAELAGRSKGTAAAELRAQAEGLREQAALLTGSARASASAGETPDPEVADAEAYVRSLAASAGTNLRSAWRADAGTARLLAATGAAQQVWAARIAELLAVPLPDAGSELPGDLPERNGTDRMEVGRTEVNGDGTPAASAGSRPGRTSGAAGSPAPEPGTDCTAAAAADGPGSTAGNGTATQSPDGAAALQAAIDAEYGAAYAYEVALAQDPAAGRLGQQWRKEASDHQARGAEAVPYLSTFCLPPVAPVAAYRLDSGFLADPAGALPVLEEAFPAVYADLVALSDGDLRGWAIGMLSAVTEELYLRADSVPATPGLDAVPDELPWN